MAGEDGDVYVHVIYSDASSYCIAEFIMSVLIFQILRIERL